ncbi:MAG: TonB-dependent receptor, partial [Sphingomonadaceae bacterium]|nr:TonB-dependent receptor [Sphingomonadaceae bacterium]
MTRRLLLIAGLLASTPLSAQTPPPPPPAAPQAADTADDAEDIVVTGQRERGSVEGDIPPEIQIRPAEIRALGASNIAEVLEAIAPQTGSGRGRGDGAPVVLLGGRRISGFNEIRDLPSEAIARIDILPEEVALKYGYRADQRVVNIVLRRRFDAVTVELEPSLATDGGRPAGQAELGYLQLGDKGRLSLNGEYEHQAPLTESERDIAPTPGSAFDARPFRTLSPESDRFALNGTLNRGLPGNVSGTLNGRFEDTATRSGFGAIATANGLDPLTRDADTRTAHLGVALNGDIAPWRWSFTANADRSRIRSLTDNAAFGGRDFARAVDRSLGADFVATGPLFALPAGAVSTTVKAGFEFRGFTSDAVRSGIATGADLSRDTASVQANFDVPVASRREAVLSPLGDLSLNFNIARDRLSDFGTLSTIGYGLNWSPFPILELIASTTHEHGAPTVQQLGNPLIATPNVRVFDVARGETVDITEIDGGNRALLADNRRVFKLGATLKPFTKTDLTLRADYTSERVKSAIASFPAITPAIEAAFPDRFTRDANGRLTRLDNRPVNFAETASDQLRWGLNFSQAIGPAPSPEALA